MKVWPCAKLTFTGPPVLVPLYVAEEDPGVEATVMYASVAVPNAAESSSGARASKAQRAAGTAVTQPSGVYWHAAGGDELTSSSKGQKACKPSVVSVGTGSSTHKRLEGL